MDGDWVLDEPRFGLAIFLDVTALECQLPLEDGQAPAGLDGALASDRPLARWQIKVSLSTILRQINRLGASSSAEAGLWFWFWGQRTTQGLIAIKLFLFCSIFHYLTVS